MEVFSTRQIIGQIELMFLLFRLVFLQGRKCWAGVSSYVMSGLACHYTWFFISHLGYFTRPAITLLRDIKQWLSISMGFNPDNFLSFWRFNPLSKIKQQKLTKQTSSQKENKVVKVEDFLVQNSSVSSDQFYLHSFFGMGGSICHAQKREPCSVLTFTFISITEGSWNCTWAQMVKSILMWISSSMSTCYLLFMCSIYRSWYHPVLWQTNDLQKQAMSHSYWWIFIIKLRKIENAFNMINFANSYIFMYYKKV